MGTSIHPRRPLRRTSCQASAACRCASPPPATACASASCSASSCTASTAISPPTTALCSVVPPSGRFCASAAEASPTPRDSLRYYRFLYHLLCGLASGMESAPSALAAATSTAAAARWCSLAKSIHPLARPFPFRLISSVSGVPGTCCPCAGQGSSATTAAAAATASAYTQSSAE